MATLNLCVKVNSADASVYAAANQPNRCLLNAANLLHALASGNLTGSVDASVSSADPVAASATITCASVAADDTVTIGKTTLTAKASPSNENQFDQSGTDTADATSLAAKINAHSVLSKIVSASSSGAVVTVTALDKGILGNHIALASSNGTRLAVTGSGYLASGAGGVTGSQTTYGR